MSQITRCPACHTVFRVVQDQLRMSDGWVRCGQCAEVFDARASLAATDAPLPEAFSPNPFENAAQANANAPDAARPADDGAMSKPEGGPIEPVLLPGSLVSAQQSIADEHLVAQGQVNASPLAELAPNEADGTLAPQVPDTALDAPFPSAPATDAPPTDAPPAATDVSFMRTMPAPAPPPSAVRRFLMALLALVLFAVLAVQIAVLERDRLAAMFPQFKPALMWMCEPLGCSVAALRQIESVVIDSSSFNRAKGDTYRLSLALRNTASVDVAIPSVELTLTDSQDQALLRRVLSASELGKPGSPESVLAAGAEWQGQATITVRMAANAERFTGYRVLAFYP